MKAKLMWVAGLAWLGGHAPARADDFKEKIVREFSLSGEAGASTLAVFNINGFVRVAGYAGDKVMLEVQKTLSADDRETLEKGKSEFKLRFEQAGDSVLVYIGEPFCSFNIRNGVPGTASKGIAGEGAPIGTAATIAGSGTNSASTSPSGFPTP